MNARRFTMAAVLALGFYAAPAIADEWYMPTGHGECGPLGHSYSPLETIKLLRTLGDTFTVEDSGEAKPAVVAITSKYFVEHGWPATTVIFFRSQAECAAISKAAIAAGKRMDAAARAAHRAAEAEETEKYK